MALTKKQQVFIENYLITWNATESARRANYAYPNVEGPKNLVNPSIKAEIEARLSEMKMSADEVLTRLADLARVDMSDFITFEDGIRLPFVDLKKAKDAGKLHLVKKIKYNAQGHLEFELHDPIAPLLNVGKAVGLFADRVEHSGPGGGPINIKEIIVEIPEESDKPSDE